MDDLLKQHRYLPVSFLLWILEWPSRAVVGCSWPGLPDDYSPVRVSVGVERAQGWNWLGQMPATVSTLRLQHETSHELVPGRFIWSGGGDGSVWLMLDKRESLRDKVYCVEETGTLRGSEGSEFDSIYSSWLEWQENKWEETEKVCQDLTEANFDEYYCEEDRLPGLPSFSSTLAIRIWTQARCSLGPRGGYVFIVMTLSSVFSSASSEILS